MDEKVLGFEEKLQKLLEEAKKKKNVLEEQEIQSFFADDHLDEDKWDAVYDFLDANKIDVLRVGNDPDMDPDMFEEDMDLDSEEEIDLEKVDLSVPEGVGVEDPVRMYLKGSARFRCSPQRKRLNWLRRSRWGMRMQNSG